MAKILFIQNEEPDNFLLKGLIVNGWKYKILSIGENTVQLIKDYSPDIIILNLSLNNPLGNQILYLVKEDHILRSILVIGIGSDFSEYRSFMDLGGDDFFISPINPSHFIEVLKRRFKINDSRINNPVEFVSEELSELKDLKDKAIEEIKIREGEYLFRSGKPARFLYYLRKGSVKTTLLDEAGNELITSILMSNDFIGFKPLIEERVYFKDCIALEDSTVLKIPRSDVFKSLSSNMQLIKSLLLNISKQYTNKEEDLLYIAYSSVKERLSVKLIELFKEIESSTITINREDLANYIGSTPETVVRALGDLKSEGHIKTKGSKISCEDLNNFELVYKN